MPNLRAAQYAGSLPCSIDLPSYISGYVDGEGCFTVSISPRTSVRVGWEARPSLSVSQNGDRNEVLLLIQEHFGCGTLRPDRSDRTVKWEIRSLPLLVDRIIPHFTEHPMLSGKQRDFELFAAICERMARGEHRRPAGFTEIALLAETMNPSGKRVYTAEAISRALAAEMKA